MTRFVCANTAATTTDAYGAVFCAVFAPQFNTHTHNTTTRTHVLYAYICIGSRSCACVHVWRHFEVRKWSARIRRLQPDLGCIMKHRPVAPCFFFLFRFPLTRRNNCGLRLKRIDATPWMCVCARVYYDSIIGALFLSCYYECLKLFANTNRIMAIVIGFSMTHRERVRDSWAAPDLGCFYASALHALTTLCNEVIRSKAS